MVDRRRTRRTTIVYSLNVSAAEETPGAILQMSRIGESRKESNHEDRLAGREIPAPLGRGGGRIGYAVVEFGTGSHFPTLPDKTPPADTLPADSPLDLRDRHSP